MIQQSICPILDTIQKRKEKILPILEKPGIFRAYLGMQISIQFFGGSDLKFIGFGPKFPINNRNRFRNHLFWFRFLIEYGTETYRFQPADLVPDPFLIFLLTLKPRHKLGFFQYIP